MKRIVMVGLMTIILLTFGIVEKEDLIHASEDDVIWLEKDYDSVYFFSNGLSMVSLKSKDGYKYGFIDKMGKEVIPLKYEMVYHFGDGLAPVTLNGERSYIDKTGKVILKTNYDYLGSFHEGLAVVFKNGKFGYINTDGKIVIPIALEGAYEFSEGMAKIGIVSKGNHTSTTHEARTDKYGYIDKKGNVI